jgi:glutaredoxin-like YruB-family protein
MKVKIYTTPSCPWCAKTKEFFKQNNVKYEEVDVSANQKAAEEMVEKSGQMGVPVTEIEGKIIVGFDEPKLRKALRLK